MDLIQDYFNFITEAKSINGSFEEFAQARHDGAKKIADAAKAKGGPAMLTYHHFVVKLPYYKKAAQGKFDLEDYSAVLQENLNKLLGQLPGNVTMEEVDFQKTMGLIEVLGELIIRYKK